MVRGSWKCIEVVRVSIQVENHYLYRVYSYWCTCTNTGVYIRVDTQEHIIPLTIGKHESCTPSITTGVWLMCGVYYYGEARDAAGRRATAPKVNCCALGGGRRFAAIYVDLEYTNRSCRLTGRWPANLLFARRVRHSKE